MADLKSNIEMHYTWTSPGLHLLDTGHFALEEEVDRIGSLVHEFLDRTINKKQVLKGR